MKIKSGFLLREIAGSSIVVPIGSRSVDFNGMITLNDTAAFLWKRLEEGATEEELVSAILDHFEDVDEPLARRSVEEFIQKMLEVGCVE